jgi:hypothetical protein
MDYLNLLICVVNLAQRNIGNRKKGFAIASDYLETWDDSDSITAINAQNIRDNLQKWWRSHSTSRYQDSEASYRHMEVVGTELRLNLTILGNYGLVTRHPER